MSYNDSGIEKVKRVEIDKAEHSPENNKCINAVNKMKINESTKSCITKEECSNNCYDEITENICASTEGDNFELILNEFKYNKNMPFDKGYS